MSRLVDADFEMVSKRGVRPTRKSNEIKVLARETGVLGPPTQEELFHIEKQAEINGIEMGVVSQFEIGSLRSALDPSR